MKKIILFLLFGALQSVAAQEAKQPDAVPALNENSIYSVSGIEKKPEFPGGLNEFYKYIAENYKVPKVKGLEGKVYVTFVIEKDGSTTDIKVLRDIGHNTGEEAIRVLANSPKWIPGEQFGRKVRVQFSLPITINTK